MTKLPHPSWKVTKVEGPQYPLNDFCPVPACPNPAEERHHLWRRSFVGGDAWWVEVDDGEEKQTYGNCIGLCRNHHRQVTDNEYRIEVDEGDFFWLGVLRDYKRMLDWQPPRYGEQWQDDIQMPLIKSNPDSGSAPKNPTQIAHTHEDVQPGKVCPSCKRRVPRPKLETPLEEKKERKTWAIGVPIGAREDGAETLDALLEAARDEMAGAGLEYGSEDTVKFYVLSTALGLFVTHAKEIL